MLSGALMMLRRMLEGALKCALRDLLREEETSVGEKVSSHFFEAISEIPIYSLALTLAIVIDRADGGQGVD